MRNNCSCCARTASRSLSETEVLSTRAATAASASAFSSDASRNATRWRSQHSRHFAETVVASSRSCSSAAHFASAAELFADSSRSFRSSAAALPSSSSSTLARNLERSRTCAFSSLQWRCSACSFALPETPRCSVPPPPLLLLLPRPPSRLRGRPPLAFGGCGFGRSGLEGFAFAVPCAARPLTPPRGGGAVFCTCRSSLKRSIASMYSSSSV